MSSEAAGWGLPEEPAGGIAAGLGKRITRVLSGGGGVRV